MPRNSGANQLATTQVLPSESANDNSGQAIDDSDLFEAKDVKVETMRSRGAGGQVKLASWLCCHRIRH
jgi:protein subunit release factor A